MRVDRNSERGATAVEYALMMACIALAIIFTIGLLGSSATGLFVADWPW